MRYRIGLLLALAMLALSACNLSSEPPTPDVTPTGQASGKPVVTINSPSSGDEFVVDEDILVSASATDGQGVTRVQLLANGQIVRTVSSESPTGDTRLDVLLDYTPVQEGTVTLEVVAYRSAVASDPASVEVEIREDQAQVTATPQPGNNVPVIDPNDPTCRALTNVGLNFRTGPGTNFSRIATIPAGAQVPLQGRLADNTWWQVRFSNQIGWVSAQFTTIYGICTGIPVVQPPASPTPANQPTNTPVPTFTPIPTNTPPPSSTPTSADLVAGTIRGPQTVIIPSGESDVTEEYSVTITNTGGRATGQFENLIILLPDNEVVPLATVGGLDPGQSITLTVDVTFTTTGINTLRVRVDEGNNIDEQFENNNENVYQVDVIAGS
jgi:hypothetical protein